MRNLMINVASWAQAHKTREEGQGVIEYALVVGGVSIVLIVVLAASGTAWIGSVTTKVTTAIG